MKNFILTQCHEVQISIISLFIYDPLEKLGKDLIKIRLDRKVYMYS